MCFENFDFQLFLLYPGMLELYFSLFEIKNATRSIYTISDVASEKVKEEGYAVVDTLFLRWFRFAFLIFEQSTSIITFSTDNKINNGVST